MSTFWWGTTFFLVLAGVWLRNDLLFLLGLFLLLTGLVSLLWTRYCLAGVTYRRRLGARRLFVGEETDLSLEIVNAKPLPLAWLRVEDEVPSALETLAVQLSRSFRPGRARLVNVLSLRWYERVIRRYRLRATRRGTHRFGPVELSSGDIFGFAVQRQRLDEPTALLVYPKIVPLTALGLPALRPFGDLQTRRRLVEDPLRLMGVRAYVPGDSFRDIHWKATAHRQALQTKRFEPAASRPVAVFLNVNTFEFLYEGIDAELQEYAITAAASIAAWAWNDGHAVGLYVNSAAPPKVRPIRIRPRSHPDQLLHILEALAAVVVVGRWPVERILQLEVPHLPSGATVVVVTATMNDALRSTLLDLHRRDFGVAVVTLGDANQGPHLAGVHQVHMGGKEEWHDLTALSLDR